MKRMFAIALGLLFLFVSTARTADDENPVKEALQSLNEYIGGWKGTGGPDNSSAPKDWNENVNWGWRFKGNDAWLSLEFKNGKYFTKGDMKYLPEKKKYELTLTDKKDTQMVFLGELKKGYLTLERVDSKSGETQQLKMNIAGGGVRMVYSYARKNKGSTLFNKVYDVNFTKEGESLAGGGKEKECVVTGGLGTIAVSYQGKTYYVCCTGCRDAFNENPEKIIKAYEERKKKGN
jgi:hypothetical protein